MKSQQRTLALKRREALSIEERLVKSNAIMDKLLPYLEKKKMIAIYMPLKEEVDISSLLFLYDSLGVPKVRNKDDMDFFLIHSALDVKEGIFNVLEPTTQVLIDPSEFEVIVVPIVAFDVNRNRIGYGKGYYDRYLKQTKALKIGVAFDCQSIDNIDCDENDIPLDYIITESKIY